MKYDEFAADLPPAWTLEFNSVEECEAALARAGVEQPMRQLGNGPYRSHLAMRSTEVGELFADRYNSALAMTLHLSPGTVGILFPRTTTGHFLANGTDIGNDKMLVFLHDAEVDIVIPPLAGSEDLVVAESCFIEMLDRLCPASVRLRGVTVVEGDEARLHALRQGVLDLLTDPSADLSPERMSSLLAEIVIWIAESSSDYPPEVLTDAGTRARVAQSARDFIEDRHGESLRIETICLATGVGTRALQRAFREHYNITISDYLKTVRLDVARRDLASARPEEDSVTSIALRHGFTHLGRFAVEFRQRFGELPSKTLATRLDQKSTRRPPPPNEQHDRDAQDDEGRGHP